MVYPSAAAGRWIPASQLNAMQPLYVEKSADQSITSSTVNVNDNALLVPVEANAKYIVNGMLLYSAHSSADIRMGWTGPSDATFEWIIHAQTTATGGVASNGVVVDRQVIGNSAFPLGGFGAENSTFMTAPLWGRLVTSTTAGTLQLNWAQQTSNATASIMRAGSWLMLTRVA
ncbi:hypothetical protein [Streptomyces sp. TBY4]|uniref:hypothetical protein n=1 Tax=Streptomyces sp. TBY4 TaxID=2962030 RepID=UPI0020B83C49|nr:hypothetical protein [Streptomyces sp. TBY4]MCP3758222.1 hypothetical protein [Streptomyces sp. TBY4]